MAARQKVETRKLALPHHSHIIISKVEEAKQKSWQQGSILTTHHDKTVYRHISKLVATPPIHQRQLFPELLLFALAALFGLALAVPWPEHIVHLVPLRRTILLNKFLNKFHLLCSCPVHP